MTQTKLYIIRSSNLNTTGVTTNWYGEAKQEEIDAAASDKLKRYSQVGEAAEALMFANGEFTARYYDADKGRVRVYQYKKIIGEGADLSEALKDATKEGWLR